MFSIRNLFVVSLLAGSVLSQETPLPNQNGPRPVPDFHEILSSLPEETLHAALHKQVDAAAPVANAAVAEQDDNAISSIHRSNPRLASKVIAEARFELIRRQANNGTTTQSTPAVIIPVPILTTDASGLTTVSTAIVLAPATVSVDVLLTTTNAQGNTVVSTSTAPAVVLTNNNGQVTTSAAPTISSGAIVMTSTNAAGETVIATFTPSGGVVSSLVLQTTTLPNGALSTFTSFKVVPATSTAKAPNLQNGAASLAGSSRFALEMALGVVLSCGMGFLLL